MLREGARVLPERFELIEADVRGVWVPLNIQDAVDIPQRHHEVDVLGSLRPMEAGLQLIDLTDLGAIRPASASFRQRGGRSKSSHTYRHNCDALAKVSPFHISLLSSYSF